MSNETKRDVYDEIVNEFGFPNDEDYKQLMERYDAAIPDDLPVIPKAVGEYIKNLWKYHRDLVDVFGMVRDLGITRTEPNGVLIWVAHNTDTFARAWVLEAWIVEETGEIVKLEAEK
ncbi:hypothetical protein [Lacticaseibacillus paracasei]|uniref:hypothetical protein n=1 Tax=Lacticaseibacillus paracasei TaxID=1597 RepID=UPI0018A60228|nr:hypothetical protein [Lacticaseibacillus paracasei]QOP47592.1 hypothetical protein G5C68_04190 [Lacticaseibacillus paracasei]